MGFWDEINALLSGGKGSADSSFPSASDASSDDPIAQALSQAGGSVPGPAIPASIDPFSNPASELIQVQSLSSQPFTVLDLVPSQATGTRGYEPTEGSQVGGPPVPGAGYTVPQSTLNQIGNALNNLGLNNALNALTLGGAFPPGVMYPFQVSGKSCRVEQLPLGGFSSAALLGGAPIQMAVGNPLLQGVSTALVGNDVRVQQLLGLFLNGLFLQFESTDAPVFIAKPGETYQLPFTKIFATSFGTTNRWRLIVGSSGASVQGFSDQRVLRQQLHLWDGGGLLDSGFMHPVPFSMRFDRQAASNTGGQYEVLRSATNLFQSVPFPDTLITTNYDSGGNLTQQGGGTGPIVGQVTNKGYKVLWITECSLRIDSGANVAVSVQLVKMVTAPGDYSVLLSVPPLIPVLVWETFDPLGGDLRINNRITYPKRCVLAGFDTYNPRTGGVQATGESLLLYATASAGFNIGGSISGYYMPSLLPNCPYPIDQMLLPTNS